MGCIESKFFDVCYRKPHITINNHNNDIINLNDIDISNVKKFTFDGTITNCKVIDVISGDSISVIMNINNQTNIFNIRMYGYDAPRIRHKSKSNKLISLEGKFARLELIKLITSVDEMIHIDTRSHDISNIIKKYNDKIVKIHLMDFDKYDEIFAKIYLDDKNKFVHELMIESNIVIPFEVQNESP
jgi:endonuclease YncB( thermonuclease family)